MTERLFLLNPDWRDEAGGPWFCPSGAYVEGILAFYPRLKDEMEIVRLDHRRPRIPVIADLGEENQSCPVLVLDGALGWPDAQISEATGRRFVQGHAIAPYLAARYGIGLPHP